MREIYIYINFTKIHPSHRKVQNIDAGGLLEIGASRSLRIDSDRLRSNELFTGVQPFSRIQSGAGRLMTNIGFVWKYGELAVPLQFQYKISRALSDRSPPCSPRTGRDLKFLLVLRD
jgi:hypothetical protein